MFVVTNGTPRRVLSMSRIDHLNTAYAVLGMQDENVGDPVLHMERIAEFVASTELPTLAPDAIVSARRGHVARTPEGKALAAAIGTAVRREYATALGDDATAGTQIAKLLVERAEHHRAVARPPREAPHRVLGDRRAVRAAGSA